MYIAQCQGFVHCSPTTTYCSAGSVRIVSVKLILSSRADANANAELAAMQRRCNSRMLIGPEMKYNSLHRT